MTTENRRMLTGFMIIGVLMIAWSFFMGGKGGKKANDGVVVIATIKKFSTTQNADSVYVQYTYQGKVVNNSFQIPGNDSLKPAAKVKLVITGNQPGKIVKYIGLAQ